MASPAKIIPTPPETLPADFSGWDSEDHPAKSPADHGEVKPVPGPRAVPGPPAQLANARSSAPPAPERSSNGPSLTPAAAFAEAEDFFQTFRPSNFYIEELEPPVRRRLNLSRKTIVIAAAVVAQNATKPNPDMNSFLPATKGAGASPQPQTPALTDSSTPDIEPASHVQPEMMNRQLTAPTLISKEMKAVPSNEAPPSAGFGAAGVEGLNSNASGAVGSVFNGPGRPKVKVEPPKIVNVSAGVAVGLLLQKTAPIYPPIAKTARVSGTVVLGATISKTGSIEGLHVISGPEMLRQSAEDAVRSWRYRPYMLNNEPVSVETTVSVIFSLGQ